jgi:uncharacterized phage protein (TIGR02220 family)
MMPQDGWVALWRQSIDSAVFADPILWKLWCLCLMKANYKKRYVQIEGIAMPVEILPGQFITGRFALHKEMYPRKKKNQKSPSTIWNKLQTLENMRNLNIRSHAKYSVITITNWEAYQQTEQQANNRLTTGEQPANTDNKEKKEKNKDIPSNGVPYQKIISHLNARANKNFKHTAKDTQRLIKVRWNEGFKYEDFIQVIDSKCSKWLTDSKMVDYLRPQTLFGTKFESYLNESPTMFEQEEFLN